MGGAKCDGMVQSQVEGPVGCSRDTDKMHGQKVCGGPTIIIAEGTTARHGIFFFREVSGAYLSAV